MNIEMLRGLVDLAGGEVDCIDVDEFFKSFPDTPANRKDLAFLRKTGYIAISYADDEIEAIGINKRAHDFFKRL